MRHLRLVVVLIGISALLAACSSGSTVAANQSVSFTVEGFDDLSYNPDTLTVPAGTPINVNFVNVGVNPHSFAIVNEGVDLFTANEEAVFQRVNTGEVEGGESFRVSIPGLEPGSYTYVCLIAGHAAAGMVGTIHVNE